MQTEPKLPAVLCPGCQIPMIAIGTETAPGNLRTTILRCETCTTETRRMYKHVGRSGTRDELA